MLDRSALLTKLVYCLRSTSNGLEPVMELNCSHKGSFEKNILSVSVDSLCEIFFSHIYKTGGLDIYGYVRGALCLR